MSKTLEELLGGRTDIDELDDDGDTCLIAVLQDFYPGGRDIEDIENDAFTLIRAGIELDWQSNTDGMAAIHWACKRGQIKVVVEMIERNVKLDARDDNGMTCFMWACLAKNYDCAFAVMDAGGTVNLMEMKLKDSDSWDRSTWTFQETDGFMAPFPLVTQVTQGAERRLQEIDQVRESFKNWSPTLVEEEILPFIYCEKNLKYLKNFYGPKKTIENVKKQGQKRKHSE